MVFKIQKDDQHREETVNVEEIIGMDDQRQADVIANKFESTANRYSPLGDSDVTLPPIP